MDSQRRRNASADLKATTEALAADARRVEAIEELKSDLPASDPRMADLSAEAQQLTAEMATKGQMESALSREAASEPEN
jgi:hypothetical protein